MIGSATLVEDTEDDSLEAKTTDVRLKKSLRRGEAFLICVSCISRKALYDAESSLQFMIAQTNVQLQ